MTNRSYSAAGALRSLECTGGRRVFSFSVVDGAGAAPFGMVPLFASADGPPRALALFGHECAPPPRRRSRRARASAFTIRRGAAL